MVYFCALLNAQVKRLTWIGNRGVTVHKIHGSVRYDTVVSRLGTFLIRRGGNWLCRNVGNISV